MSLSVILITLGIIQTLLFETLTFFSEIAEVRGWFSMDVEFNGLFSMTGLAAALFLGIAAVEHFTHNGSWQLNSIPEVLFFPGKFIVAVIFTLAFIQIFLNSSQFFGLALFLCIITWRRIGQVYFLQKSEREVEAASGWQSVLLCLFFLSTFISITGNYGGALGEFFFQSQWTPTGACADRRGLCETMSFGVNSLLLTTLQVAFGALLIAVPLGVGCAIYLSEYAPPRLVSIIKPTLELLAGIPSVVYGFFAFIYIGPLVVEFGDFAYAQGWIDQSPNVLNPINGAIVVGIMILPLIASMSEDALRAVPNELREGSLALGATRIETTLRVMIQAALSGIIAGIILALSRAVGETMAVTLAVGTVAVFTSNMFVPAQTMTAYIAQRVGGDLPFGEIGYLTIFAVGLYLFVITLCLNLLGNRVLTAYREAY